MKQKRLYRRLFGSALMLLAALEVVSGRLPASTPTNVWQAAGAYGGVFSGDGTAIFLTTATGFEVHRATDGALLAKISVPTASQASVVAFSPDKQFAALGLGGDGAPHIEIWRFSDGKLARTITSDAVRAYRALSFSPNGLLASMERFAYGGGGMLRVFSVATGALIQKQGPYAHNSNNQASFSPNGQYLAVYDANLGATRILNTSNWGTVLALSYFVTEFQWSPDSKTIWTYGSSTYGIPFEQIEVPSGLVDRSIMISDSLQLAITAATPDTHGFLAYQPVSTDPSSPVGDTLEFLRTSNGSAAVVYKPVKTRASSSAISPDGKLFAYNICPPDGSACSFFMAKTPSF